MSSRQSFEQDLARLNAVRADPNDPDAADVLSRALAARSNLLAARAAEIIEEWELASFVPELVVAFDRFLSDATRRDPTCAAKFAIVEALNRLDAREADLFRRGARHVQLEPVWGGYEDTAAGLRAACALGLARADPPDTMLILAGLLADTEADARTGAVRAIANAVQPGGAPLLWYKALLGDDEPAVMFECFSALLILSPEQALALVREQASAANTEVAEAAVLALGYSRLPAALPLLVELRQEASDPALRRATLTAIATLGDDSAFAFLLDLLNDGPPNDAADALDALALFRDDERRRRKIERAVRKRDDLPPGRSPYSTT